MRTTNLQVISSLLMVFTVLADCITTVYPINTVVMIAINIVIFIVWLKSNLTPKEP